MIARMWHGRTRAANAGTYLEYPNQSGIPDSRRSPGNLGAWVFRRIEGDVAHFIALTYWESREAIRAFAGDDIELARYYPEDKQYLLEFEPGVAHYEVFAAQTVALETTFVQEAGLKSGNRSRIDKPRSGFTGLLGRFRRLTKQNEHRLRIFR
jgi:heme-degrading monooxygenase HmoA